ncbi:GyrI-like domain-containing protein [Candidatus Enterococcus ikei]|uniref:GyrI-like domain-containing protein n=1 Tax=Candidatus Enterococcus ikei TaxID=2815326 RepID=A0ABS3GUU0_9ENTE|nr:GyrI-like domain-containing protein [Enterococcus sp. DIV0869a]MBO0439024.1 GyrI-like domain-containing protein [Enterococcus sp. DIV0869a]
MTAKLDTKNEINILSIRKEIALTDFDEVYAELFSKVADEKYTVVGSPLVVYHDEEFNPESNDTELAIPVAEKTGETRVIPGGTYACIICKEDFSQLPKYYEKLVNWIHENEYTILGKPFEQYLEESENKTIVEINFLVK